MFFSFSMSIAVEAFFIGLGLIIPIGIQNMYILRQGIAGKHYLFAPLICSLCDSVLIFAGAMGVASVFLMNIYFRRFAIVGAVLFLSYYALRSFRKAFFPVVPRGLSLEGVGSETLRIVFLSSLAFSFLNPHAILDVTILLGGIAAQYTDFSDRLSFTLGACLASWVWFFSLSSFGKLLRPIFKKPLAMQILDVFVGAVMFVIVFLIIRSELLGEV